MDCRNRGLMYVDEIYNACLLDIDFRGNQLTVDTIKKISDGLQSKQKPEKNRLTSTILCTYHPPPPDKKKINP